MASSSCLAPRRCSALPSVSWPFAQLGRRALARPHRKRCLRRLPRALQRGDIAVDLADRLQRRAQIVLDRRPLRRRALPGHFLSRRLDRPRPIAQASRHPFRARQGANRAAPRLTWLNAQSSGTRSRRYSVSAARCASNRCAKAVARRLALAEFGQHDAEIVLRSPPIRAVVFSTPEPQAPSGRRRPPCRAARCRSRAGRAASRRCRDCRKSRPSRPDRRRACRRVSACSKAAAALSRFSRPASRSPSVDRVVAILFWVAAQRIGAFSRDT